MRSREFRCATWVAGLSAGVTVLLAWTYDLPLRDPDNTEHYLVPTYVRLPSTLAVALVWSRNRRSGEWYMTAIALDWVLGALTYLALPALGPIYADPADELSALQPATRRLRSLAA